MDTSRTSSILKLRRDDRVLVAGSISLIARGNMIKKLIGLSLLDPVYCSNRAGQNNRARPVLDRLRSNRTRCESYNLTAIVVGGRVLALVSRSSLVSRGVRHPRGRRIFEQTRGKKA